MAADSRTYSGHRPGVCKGPVDISRAALGSGVARAELPTVRCDPTSYLPSTSST